MTGGACYYCGFAAEDIEHVIPYAYSADNSLDNLVPSCSICNSIAGSQVFASLQSKKDYILTERNSVHWKRKLGRMVRTVVTPAIGTPKRETKRPERSASRPEKARTSGKPPRPRLTSELPMWREETQNIFTPIRQEIIQQIKRAPLDDCGYVLLCDKRKYVRRRFYFDTRHIHRTRVTDETANNATKTRTPKRRKSNRASTNSSGAIYDRKGREVKL